MDSGHWKRALKLIDTLWAKDSSDPELRALRGTALSKSGRGASLAGRQGQAWAGHASSSLVWPGQTRPCKNGTINAKQKFGWI